MQMATDPDVSRKRGDDVPASRTVSGDMLHTALVTRIRGEYENMPGLRLKQAQRLFGVDGILHDDA